MEKDSSQRLKALLVDGGMTKNDLLMQIQANFNGKKMIYLTLSEPTFFVIFITFRKLVVIKLIFAIEQQTVHQTKGIIHSYFLLESDFEITF